MTGLDAKVAFLLFAAAVVGPTREPIFTAESAAKSPVVIERCPPRVPQGVRVRMGKDALFVYSIVVSSQGRVVSAQLSDTGRPFLPELAEISRESLFCWKFYPSHFRGKPVAYRMRVTVKVPRRVPPN